MLKKLRSRDYRKSLYVKEFMLLIVASIAILLCMELTSLYYLSLYKRRAMENYQNSLELYCSYIDSELGAINSSLISLTNSSYEGYYFKVCYTKEALELETSKIILMKQMAGIAQTHNNKILVFTYIPERNIYLKSSNVFADMAQRKDVDQKIKEYVTTYAGQNETTWNYMESGNNKYFINVYHVNSGYVGAVISYDTILSGLMKKDIIMNSVSIMNSHGQEVRNPAKGSVSGRKALSTFSVEMEHMNSKIQITVLENRLYSDLRFMLLISISVIFVGVVVIILSAKFQMKMVLNPLNRLKKGMERFSRGDLDFRLEEDYSTDEINVLYKTFNNMAAQISKLKIEVYEFEIEKQKIQSDFLRVQIQPHFYTNILNFIYGLAEMKDYGTIQKLSQKTAGFFRYLMGEKGTFVLLREELACVNNYIDIQKLRYEDCLDIAIEVQDKLEEQLVLPMILQTFVENSIKHNITMVPVLKVTVRITGDGKRLYLSVEDNGLGFSEEIIRKWNNKENISENGEHIGIMNVKKRMEMLYHKQVSIQITSVPGNSSVLITVPQILTEEENKNEFTSGR